MKALLTSILFSCILIACNDRKSPIATDKILADGQMPNAAKDNNGTVHLVYGRGDSLMYMFSSDKGNSFSSPSIIAVLPHLAASSMRGPQIATTNNAVVVAACTSEGDMFSYYKEKEGWKQGARLNDVDTIAKEGLMDLSADGDNAFAVWLDLRENKQNKIYGAGSRDGGRTWSQNKLIYASPDTTVCECCKPSVLVKGDKVYVMFRNWLNGNRDLYLIQSSNGGQSFGAAQKLGIGSWKLDGCPMDGGGLAIDSKEQVHTVWRREADIYAAMPGKQETKIGSGKGVTMQTINDKPVYAWSENGEIVLLNPDGAKISVGKGSLPVLEALDDSHVLCLFEKDKQIHAAVVNL